VRCYFVGNGKGTDSGAP